MAAERTIVGSISVASLASASACYSTEVGWWEAGLGTEVVLA